MKAKLKEAVKKEFAVLKRESFHIKLGSVLVGNYFNLVSIERGIYIFGAERYWNLLDIKPTAIFGDLPAIKTL